MNANFIKTTFIAFSISLLTWSCTQSTKESDMKPEDMMIRIAEIEIDSTYFDDYISILKEESAASIALEPGVLCIYPMYRKDDPTSIRLLEIYADRNAYESHLKTEHFLKYKTSTMHMVISLKLIDMEAIDPQSMDLIFEKLQERN
ncbi:putative quinol monooxygenase [Marinoscillum pacificum]|uniref:putative quinol monooxygenase n=1 Tax=Marinoscillum pacificum TaxID=392723 RepID=UPI002157D7ED|nr:antibiotic biosynthesis monooxygenase [Marinoscillum pacificum]